MCETKKLCRLIEKKVSWKDKYRYSFARDIIIDIISESPEKLSDIKKYYQHNNQLMQKENENNIQFTITTMTAIISIFISVIAQLNVSDNIKIGAAFSFVFLLFSYLFMHGVVLGINKHSKKKSLFIADIVDSINASDLTAKKRN